MALIKEAINHSPEWKEGKLKLKEPRTGTKDIIVALSYGNDILSIIENKLTIDSQQDEEFNIDDWSWIVG